MTLSELLSSPELRLRPQTDVGDLGGEPIKWAAVTELENLSRFDGLRWDATGQIRNAKGGNHPGDDLPRVQAVHVLLDSATLTPRALLEGSVLTALRTPAVSAVAADALALADDAGLLPVVDDVARVVVGPGAVEVRVHLPAVAHGERLVALGIVDGPAQEAAQRQHESRRVAVRAGRSELCGT